MNTSISGKYKFYTVAVADDFRACFITLSFFQGETQLTSDEFAQAVSNGNWSEFNQIKSDYQQGSFFDLSIQVKANILVSNSKGNIVFNRTIENLLEYSYFNLVSDIANYTYLLIPDINVIIDAKENNGYSVYGLISSQGTFFNENKAYTSPRSISSGLDPLEDKQFDFYSFKDLEPILQIESTSRLTRTNIPGLFNDYYEFETGSVFFSYNTEFSYMGKGLWVNQVVVSNRLFEDGSYTTAFNDCSFIHNYPVTEILPATGLPAISNIDGDLGGVLTISYNLDFDNSKSISYETDPVVLGGKPIQVYYPIVKDSKTGNLISLEIYKLNPFQPFITEEKWKLHSGGVAVTDFFYDSNGDDYYPQAFYTSNKFSSGFYVYDDLLFDLVGTHNKNGKTDVSIKINNKYPLLFNNSLQSETFRKIQLPLEFQEALESANPTSDAINLAQLTDTYSQSTKNYWRFCNAVLIKR